MYSTALLLTLLSVTGEHILPVLLSELAEGELADRTRVQAVVERGQLLLAGEVHTLEFVQ